MEPDSFLQFKTGFWNLMSFEISKLYERFSLIKYYFQADSVTKSKCEKLCEENYWMASLPNVNDFDWLREQFVDKEYFQIAGGMSFRKQLKHIGGNCCKAHKNSYGRDGSKSH